MCYCAIKLIAFRMRAKLYVNTFLESNFHNGVGKFVLLTVIIWYIDVNIMQGYRTGYVYREPPVSQADEGKQVQHSEVIVPPAVSSHTYSFEEDTGKEPT